MRLVLRTPLWHRLLGLFGFLTEATFFFVFGTDFGSIGTIVGAVAAVVLTCVGVRWWLLRVEIRAGDLIVVNWTRTVRRPLTDVRFFSGLLALTAELRDGSSIQADAFGPWALSALLADVRTEAACVCQDALRRDRDRRRR